MEMSRTRFVRHQWGMRTAWLMFALAACLYCAWRFAGPSPLQTNLLALLPATEVDPVAEKAVNTLATAFGERTVLLVTSRDATHAKAAARQLGAMLQGSGAFASVTAELPPFDVSQIAGTYLPFRFGLLAPADRAALNGEDGALRDALIRRLYGPPRGGLTTTLADDPFGWLEHWLGSLPLATSNLQIEDRLLVARHGDATSVLVTATLPGSAYETGTQRAVRNALAHAQDALARSFPDVTLARTGAVFYAEAARAASEREVHLIGAVSLCGIALLMLWVFRSPRLLLLGFISTALGIVGALAATMLLFGQLHLLTLVFGASLIGEAVDYSIQYFVVHLGANERNWHPLRSARAVRPALSVALATSLLGYAILAWVPFPALKQIACFAIVGISMAFASVLWLLPSILVRPVKRRPQRVFAGAGRLLGHWHAVIGGRRAWWVAGVLLVVAVPGWLRLTSNDDIHLLIEPDASLAAQERTVREATGIDQGTQFFVVRGDSPEQVLQRSEALSGKLEHLSHDARLGGFQSLSAFVPSLERQREDRERVSARVFNDPAALRALLVKAGFRPDVADAWLAEHAQSNGQGMTVERWLAAPWSRPFRHLWLGEVDRATHVYAAVVTTEGVTAANEAALIATAHEVAGVSFVDKAASISQLFSAYRIDSGLWLAGAMLVVLATLVARYRLRGGVAVALPVVLAVGVTLALFGYADVPLNLFNWLALMLVLGVGANYAVFLREGCLRAGADLGAVWAGVLLSAATTLLSFGLLAMSAMPVLKAFGTTLALGIAIAVLLAPIGMPPTGERTRA
jgi:predicted exporter